MKIFISFLLVVFLILPSSVWSEWERRAVRQYQSILKDWTREDEAYNWGSLEARLVWYATYQSSSFRKAKTERFAALYELGDAEIAKLQQRENEDAQQYDTFFISIYAGSRVYPDIGKNRSLWRLVLETPEGEIVEPSSWEEVPSNQVTRTLYPYTDRWSKAFEVRFPKVIKENTEWAHLKMVGVPADSVLDWNLEKIRKRSL